MPKRYTYQPHGNRFAPGLRPGDTLEARDQAQEARLDADPCFTPLEEPATPDEAAEPTTDTTPPARKRGKK